MEAQVITSALTKENLPVQSASTQTPIILIEKIMDSRNNPNFRGVMLRWKTERGNATSSLVSFALGGANEENRVAIQTFSNAVIDKFKISEGKDINAILAKAGMPLCRLTVSEITETQFKGLSATDKAGYSAKVNPSSGEMLMHEGQQIYRKVSFDAISSVDKYLQASVSAPISDLTV